MFVYRRKYATNQGKVRNARSNQSNSVDKGGLGLALGQELAQSKMNSALPAARSDGTSVEVHLIVPGEIGHVSVSSHRCIFEGDP